MRKKIRKLSKLKKFGKSGMLQEIREYYRLPQSTLAQDLRVSRSHFSMMESRRRSMPTDILLALIPIHTAIVQPAKKRKDEKLSKALTAQEAELSELIDYRKEYNKYKLIPLEKKLAAMKEDQARSIQILEMLVSLMANAKPKAISLLNSIEQQARNIQKKTGKNSQLKLELKIHNLKAELNYLNNR